MPVNIENHVAAHHAQTNHSDIMFFFCHSMFTVWVNRLIDV